MGLLQNDGRQNLILHQSGNVTEGIVFGTPLSAIASRAAVKAALGT